MTESRVSVLRSEHKRRPQNLLLSPRTHTEFHVHTHMDTQSNRTRTAHTAQLPDTAS
jgi:hypothetical protein